MDQHMRNELDNYITGHYGEDQFANETRKRNVCGESWQDDGDPICPFCMSENTEIVPES